jgi:drug/metabolite transporter (DMT)-like permease
MLTAVIVFAAAACQVARNAAQRGVMGEAGPWGATLVRFLFGLPFAAIILLFAWTISARPELQFTRAYGLLAAGGAAAQVLATAALLAAMRRAGFAVGTAWAQSSMPLTALLGFAVFGDALSPFGWAGIALATGGLAALAAKDARDTDAGRAERLSGAVYGLLSGLFFGLSFNAYRHAVLIVAPGEPLLGATVTVLITQAGQSAVLVSLLAWLSPRALAAVYRNWRGSLAAGLAGASASAFWLTALGISPAAVVRALGVMEAPIAALAGRRLFAERLTPWQWMAGLATAAGVAFTALG